jgi:hypothetical protein
MLNPRPYNTTDPWPPNAVFLREIDPERAALMERVDAAVASGEAGTWFETPDHSGEIFVPASVLAEPEVAA